MSSEHHAPPMAPTDPLVGVELDNYRVEEKIAEGGMGLIYRAVHSVIGRQAAIKVLSHRYSDDLNMIKRLHREAVAVNRIGHPSIVDIFGFGRTPDNREYFIMEFLEGESLAQIIDREGALPWSFTSQVFTQSLDALAAAHDLDIIHRDIKPENILVTQGDNGEVVTKVLDFGIAKSIGVGEAASEQLTRAGSVMGTPEYIAPEQIRGRPVDGRADLYAMGVILFEMISGRRPYDSDQVMNLLMSHLRDPIPEVGALKPELGIPKAAANIIPKAMAKAPEERFQDARSFAQALGLSVGSVTADGGTRPLPDTFWEMDASQGTGEVPGQHSTAPRPALITSAGGRQAPTETQLPITEERPKRSPLIWIAPLLLILLSGAAIAFVALRNGGDGEGSGSTAVNVKAGTAQGTAATKPSSPDQPFAAVTDMEDLLFRVRKTLNKGLLHKTADIRRRAVVGVGELHDRNVKEQLVEVLKTDTELTVRSTAAKALSQLGDRSVARTLKDARRIQQPVVRVAIDDALRRLHDPAGKKGLRKALKDKDRGVRVAAALALADSGDPAVRRVLEPMLSAANAQLTAPVLAALARTGHAKALETLRRGMAKGTPKTRLPYAEALAKLGDDGAVTALRGMLDKGELTTRIVAAKNLAGLGNYGGLKVLRRGVRHAAEQTRVLATDALGAVGDKAALPPLAAALDDKVPLVRVTAAESLARILALMPTKLLRRSQNWLLAALTQGDWSARYAAVGITSEMDPELAVELLGWALKDKDERVRAAAVRRLAKLAKRSAKARRYVRARLFNDASPKVRAAAAEGLGSSGNKRDKELLVAAARADKSRSVVGIAAAGQLLAMGDTRGLKGLLKATKAKDAGTRSRAYRALARWNNAARRRAVLERGLKDKSAGVRLAAALALAKLGHRDGQRVLAKAVEKDGSQPALAALAKLKVPMGKRVKILARSKSPEARRTAMTAAVPALGAGGAMALLRKGAKDDNVKVRRAAATALAKIAVQKPTVAPLLRKLAKDPDLAVRSAAAVGLNKLEQLRAKKAKKAAPKVEPVKQAPEPAEPKVPKQAPKAAKAAKAGQPSPKLELSFIEDNRREATYKSLSASATLSVSNGKLQRALKLLHQANKLSRGRAVDVYYELGYVHWKIAVRAKAKGKRREAQKNAKRARYFYQRYLGRAPGGKRASKARGGTRDVKRLLKQLRGR